MFDKVFAFSHIKLFYWERYCKGRNRIVDGCAYSLYADLCDDGSNDEELLSR